MNSRRLSFTGEPLTLFFVDKNALSILLSSFLSSLPPNQRLSSVASPRGWLVYTSTLLRRREGTSQPAPERVDETRTR